MTIPQFRTALDERIGLQRRGAGEALADGRAIDLRGVARSVRTRRETERTHRGVRQNLRVELCSLHR